MGVNIMHKCGVVSTPSAVEHVQKLAGIETATDHLRGNGFSRCPWRAIA